MARRAGSSFEDHVAAEYGFTHTTNSGAKHGDGDLRHSGGRFIVECKDLGIEGFSIPAAGYKKVVQQALSHGDGNFVWFQRNAQGKVVVSMNEELFKLLFTVADGVITCPCGKKIRPDW